MKKVLVDELFNSFICYIFININFCITSMRKARKNYFIYLMMLLIFGGLIYTAIAGGERFFAFVIYKASDSR